MIKHFYFVILLLIISCAKNYKTDLKKEVDTEKPRKENGEENYVYVYEKESPPVSTPKSSNKPTSPSYSSCTASGAKSFAKKRINTTIGRTQFLDLHRDLENKWLFYGSAYSSRYNRDVTVWVLINCSNGSYDAENVEVDI